MPRRSEATYRPDSRFSRENIEAVDTHALVEYHKLAEWTLYISREPVDEAAWNDVLVRLETEMTKRRKERS